MVDTRDVVEVAGAASAGAAAGAIAYRAWRNTTERTIMDGKPTTLQRVEASRLGSDADTFQFKSGGDQSGVTDRLQGVKSWNPAAAGKVMVYEYADGRQVIADGHQRLGLARRLMSEGHEPIKMDAIVLRQQDGWQPRDVRAFAAIKNMHESSGASLDMARVMRERPDLVTISLPISDGKIREAKALARLSDPAFKMVASGTVKPEIAAAVGDAVKDSSRHLDYLSEMQKAKVASGQHARLYVQQAMAAPSLTETTGSLFGEETTTRSLLKERAQVLDKALTALKQDKRIFGLLEREAGTIESVGNRLSHEANAAKAAGSGRLAEMVEKLSTTRGPISEMLDKAAAAIAKGEAPAKAARAFVKEVGDTMKRGGMSALTGNAPARMQAMADDGRVKLGAGDVVRSASGRNLTPFPKVDTTTNGKTTNTLKRVDAWLHAEALAEARATRNDFVETMLKGMNPAKMTTADRDSLNQVLFGDPDGPSSSAVTRAAPSGRSAQAKSPRTVGNSPHNGGNSPLTADAQVAQSRPVPPAVSRNIDRLESLGWQGFRDAAKALNIDTSGGNSEIRARIEAASHQDWMGRLQQVADKFESAARAANESELKALMAKTGAPPEAQAKAVAAGMAEADRAGAEMMKGRPGWSDAARIRSADERGVARPGEAKPPESRRLGQMTVPDAGSPEKPVPMPNGNVGWRKDGFWYIKTDMAVHGGGMRVTDPTFQAQADAHHAKTSASVSPPPEPKAAAKPQSTTEWLAEREQRIRESKAAGTKHLDMLPRAVEGMRGVAFHNVHDPKERGFVRTVANTGEVVVQWADEYSANKNLAPDPVKDGKRMVRQSWLAPTDLKDYAVSPAKGQTSFIPPPTTKEKITAASASKASPRVPQQPMDQGLFGSGMKQLDLVEMAKGKPAAPAPTPSRTVAVVGRPSGYAIVDAETGEVIKGGFRTKGNAVTSAKDMPDTVMAKPEQAKVALDRAIRRDSFTPETSGLRGTQNPNNLAAIVENRQANAAPADLSSRLKGMTGAQINAILHDGGLPHSGTRAQKEARIAKHLSDDVGRKLIDHYASQPSEASAAAKKAKALRAAPPPPPREAAWSTSMKARADNEYLRRAVAAAKQPADLAAAAQSAGVRDPNAAMKDVFGSGLRYPTEEAATRARAADSAKRMFSPPTPEHPPRSILEQSAVTRAGVPYSKARKMTVETLKATLKKEGITEVHGSGGKSWKLLSVLGPAAVVGAAAVAFDATRSEALAAGNSTTTTLAKSTAAATVAGGGVAATMWGIGKGVQVAGGALAAVAPRAAAVLVPGGAMVLGGLAAYHAGKAAVEGYRKDGLKGAAVGVGDWATMGAVSHFGPRLTASGASQFETANAAYSAMKGNEAANTDSARKPGWGPEARIAAAKAQGAVMLPYGGNPENAPGYVPPEKSKPKP